MCRKDWFSYHRGADIICTSTITLPVGALTASLLGKPISGTSMNSAWPIENWKAALNRSMIEFPERVPETL